jgi:hypothetical protein
MPDFVSPSRSGATYNNAYGSDADSLFLKVFSGEIITTFEKYNVMMPLHRVRTIQSGKSAQFPVTGVAGAKYHVPGESVLSEATGTAGFAGASSSTFATGVSFDTGNSPTSKYLNRFRHAEKTILIDDILISSVFVADIDEMKNHYDVRSTYSTEIGRALAYTADKNLIRTVIAGARKTTDRFGVASGTDTTYLGAQVGLGATPTGASIITGLFNAAQKMDEKNVPSMDRYAILTPALYYKLVADGKDALNRDYGNDANGSIAGGEVLSVAGIRIMKSNNLPSGNESSTQDLLHGASGVKNDLAGADTGYSGLDYSTTRGIVFHREAIGTVKLMDLSLESEYQMDRLGTLMLAKYAMGHNILREECCFELTAA